MLIQFPDTRLVVIDPISAYTGNVDSHKNSDVRGLLAPLRDDYEILDGTLRYRIFLELGVESVPCLIAKEREGFEACL